MSAQGSIYTGGSTSLTDNTGAYEILITPQKQNAAIPSLFAGWTVSAQPEQGQLYFASSATVPDTTGSDPIVVDFELLNGIPLRGRVIEQTGKASQAAVVEYYPLFPNPHSPKLTNGPSVAASSCRLRPDGSYRLAVLPGPGVVCVAASPRDWYALAMVDEDELAGLVNDGISHDFGLHLRTAFGAGKQGLLSPDRYNVLSLINPGERTELPALNLKLQRSRPITGTVVGIDGQPLSGTALAGLNGLAEDMVLEDASFNVRGLNPHQNRALVFHHYKLGLGKTLIVHGEQTEPLTVQLEPCGSVVGRLVDKGGKPISAAGLGLNARDGRLSSGAQTDQQGRFRAAVVPGRKYWLGAFPPFRLVAGDQAVELKSGQVKDLGDLFVGD